MENKQEQNIIYGKNTLLYRRLGQLSCNFQYLCLSYNRRMLLNKNRRYRTKIENGH
jgi:hypothetical protein